MLAWPRRWIRKASHGAVVVVKRVASVVVLVHGLLVRTKASVLEIGRRVMQRPLIDSFGSRCVVWKKKTICENGLSDTATHSW